MSEPAEPLAPEVPEACLLGPNDRFRGLVAFQGRARLEGQLAGEVLAQGTLRIGAEARVWARVEADEVVIAGAIEGEVHARRSVCLLDGARVRGSIHAPNLRVDEGARIDGRLETGEDAFRP